MVRYKGAPMEAPAEPLLLWDYDGNQFSRLVRRYRAAAASPALQPAFEEYETGRGRRSACVQKRQLPLLR